MNFKKTFENKYVAIIIMIVMIISSALYGVHRSLSRMSKEVNNIFYQGVDNDGIGIFSDLNIRINQSQNLLTIARKYDIDEDLINSIEVVLVDLSNGNNSIANKYQSNLELTSKTNTLIAILNDLEEVSDNDISFIRNIEISLLARNDTIFRDPYNLAVKEYNDQLEEFPTNILRKLIGIKKIEYFR